MFVCDGDWVVIRTCVYKWPQRLRMKSPGDGLTGSCCSLWVMGAEQEQQGLYPRGHLSEPYFYKANFVSSNRVSTGIREAKAAYPSTEQLNSSYTFRSSFCVQVTLRSMETNCPLSSEISLMKTWGEQAWLSDFQAIFQEIKLRVATVLLIFTIKKYQLIWSLSCPRCDRIIQLS